MASAVIELQNVSLSFDRDSILENVNLQILEGERVILIGPSGSGKSVLLKIMGGIIEPTSGVVRISGQAYSEMSTSERELARRKMGMLFQKNALFDSLTCLENVQFPLREVSALPADQIYKRALHLLASVGIEHAADLFPDEISGGMQKRLGIARSLALEPQIIFYDDPTAGLDPITSRKIVDLILELQKKENSTLVAVTNDMNRAYQLADRILMVSDRGVVDAGSPAQIKNSQNLTISNFVRGIQ